MLRASRYPLPAWSWSYVAFRFGDGLSHALVALAVILHYELPLWALAVTTAAMNLAGVPAAFLWGHLMEGGRGRRRIAVAGFALSAVGMAVLAFLPPFAWFVGGAIAYTVFGIATAPASSILVLEGVERKSWADATASLSKTTGWSYLAGTVVAIGLGLAGLADFRVLFAVAAVASIVAAATAWLTIKPFDLAPRVEPVFDKEVTTAAQRRFERVVFFPGRLRHLPDWRTLLASLRRPERLWPLGFLLTFAGSVAFFTSYPGVLAEHVGLTAGWILLAQFPSHLVTPMSYPWAGRYGARHGEGAGIRQGILIRAVALPVYAVGLFLLGPFGLAGLPLFLVLHGLFGLAFALLQVNGPCLLAHLHPRGRGQGVGIYHASVGAGTVLGAIVAFVTLAAWPFYVSYIVAIAIALLGAVLLLRAVRGLAPS